MKTLHLTVRTPQKTLLTVAEADWIQVRLADGGGIGILPRHAPLLAATVDAPLCYADADGEHSLGVAAGILHITSEAVTVFTSGLLDKAAEKRPLPLVTPTSQRFDRLVHALLAKRPSRDTLHAETTDEKAG